MWLCQLGLVVLFGYNMCHVRCILCVMGDDICMFMGEYDIYIYNIGIIYIYIYRREWLYI